MEPSALARVGSFLRYARPARWTAVLCGIATAVLYALLILLLALFADLLVTRGRIPNFAQLPVRAAGRGTRVVGIVSRESGAGDSPFRVWRVRNPAREGRPADAPVASFPRIGRGCKPLNSHRYRGNRPPTNYLIGRKRTALPAIRIMLPRRNTSCAGVHTFGTSWNGGSGPMPPTSGNLRSNRIRHSFPPGSARIMPGRTGFSAWSSVSETRSGPRHGNICIGRGLDVAGKRSESKLSHRIARRGIGPGPAPGHHHGHYERCRGSGGVGGCYALAACHLSPYSPAWGHDDRCRRRRRSGSVFHAARRGSA